MTIYVLIEHDPHNPKEGFKEHAIGLYLDKDKAQFCADEYNKVYFPYIYSVERAEVME